MNKAELDEEWRRWRTWLRGGIRQDVMTMLASRQVWRRYSELVQQAPQLVQRNRTFHTWVTHNYLDGIGTGIRRQTDLREDVIALARLLHRVARYPQALSRDRFASDDESESRLSADEAFDELVGENRDFIDPVVPGTDLQTLLDGTSTVRRWIDKEVAHFDPKRGRFSAGLKIEDIHAALDIVADLLRRYSTLIIRTHIVTDRVALSAWERIFTTAWLESPE